MVPESYHDFFVASTGAGAALLGLLFVAVSISPVRTAMSPTASSAYIALLNAFFLSLVALLPRTHLGPATLVLGLLGLAHNFRFAWRVERRRERSWLTGALGAAFILIGVLLYGYELVNALQLLHSPNDSSPISSLAGVLVGIYAFGLASAWQLLRGRIQGLSGRLLPLPEAEGSQAESRMDQPHSRR